MINELLNKIDNNKRLIQDKRPFSKEELIQLKNYFKIGLTYSSNAIEGNTYTITETKILIEDGLTASGKPLKEALETIGHSEAYDYMYNQATKKNLKITEELICNLHRLFYYRIDEKNAGKYRKIQVLITGTEYVPPSPQKISALMKEFITEINKKAMHGVLLSAYAHRRLAEIHPFIDGNGRTARLLMNLILINKGYQVISIPPVLRADYITALQTAQRAKNPNDAKFNQLIAECEIEAQKEIIRMFHIED